MRISEKERELINTTVHNYDPESKIFLFGSRVDDNKKGGDIDLLIITRRNSFLDQLNLKGKLKEKIGDQKIDLLLTDNQESAFVKNIFQGALVL